MTDQPAILPKVSDQVLYLETLGSVEIPTPVGPVQYCPRDGSISPEIGYLNRKGQRMIKHGRNPSVPLARYIYEHLFSPLTEMQDLRFLDKDRGNLALRNLYVKTSK